MARRSGPHSRKPVGAFVCEGSARKVDDTMSLTLNDSSCWQDTGARALRGWATWLYYCRRYLRCATIGTASGASLAGPRLSIYKGWLKWLHRILMPQRKWWWRAATAHKLKNRAKAKGLIPAKPSTQRPARPAFLLSTRWRLELFSPVYVINLFIFIFFRCFIDNFYLPTILGFF